MIGRMSSMQFNQSSLDALLDAQARLQRTQEELASGKRLLNPSDDPVAAAQLVSLRSELSRIETYQRTINIATNELASTETTVAEVEDVLNQAARTALRAANQRSMLLIRRLLRQKLRGFETNYSRLLIVKPHRENLCSLALRPTTRRLPTRSWQEDSDTWVDLDTSLFVDNSFVSQVTYQGDANAREVNIASGVTLATRVTGEDLFGASVFDADNDTLNAFEALSVLAQGIRGELPEPPEESPLGDDVVAKDLIYAGIDGIDAALTRASNVRADLGVRMNRVNDQASLHYDFSLSISKTISGLEDLDYAKAVSELSARMLALESAQKAYAKMQGISLFNYL